MTTETRETGALCLAIAPITHVQVRDTTGTGGDGAWTMEGYAAVFEQETVLYDSNWLLLREEISGDAFQNVLARVRSGDELVHFNFGHDMNTAIAATDVAGIGSLELAADPHGLRFFARIDSSDPDAVRLAAKMRRGVVKQASFAFTIASEELVSAEIVNGQENELWRITEIGHLYDVCATPQGAYSQTESYLRDLASASLGRSGIAPGGQPVEPEAAGGEIVAPESTAGVTIVAPAASADPAGVGDPARALQLAQLRARARVLTAHHPKEQT